MEDMEGLAHRSLPEDRILDLLRTGNLEILGLLPRASNATLLARVTDGDLETLAVYKPRRGERPLWDFPRGTLCLREMAAWVVDRALGWDLVPPTVLREDPEGYGAVQLFVDEDPEVDVQDVLESAPDVLRRIAVFDVLVNNADRKGGHCITDVHGNVWSVDHGICFHDEPKLRTVIWAFEGETVPTELMEDVESFVADEDAHRSLEELLHPAEIEALDERAAELLRTRRFPSPGPGRHHVPWPPW